MATACPGRTVPRHFRGHPAGHELTHHLSVVIASSSSYEDSGLFVRERAAIRRATPYGMLVDDEYWPSDENAARELVEVYRLVYGISLAGSVEIQEGRCQCVQEKARVGRKTRADRRRSAVRDGCSTRTLPPTEGLSWTLRMSFTGT